MAPRIDVAIRTKVIDMKMQTPLEFPTAFLFYSNSLCRFNEFLVPVSGRHSQTSENQNRNPCRPAQHVC